MKRKLATFFLGLALTGATAANAEPFLPQSPAPEPLTAAIRVDDKPAFKCGQASDENDFVKWVNFSKDNDENPFICVETEEIAKGSLYSNFDTGSTPEVCGKDAPPVFSAGYQDYLNVADSVKCGEKAVAQTALPDVPIVVNKKVDSFITYFQGRGRKYYEKWLGRSGDYMTMLREVLRQNGVPEDLSYIAFIESGLNPTVKSRANAVGMWQFIKGTAKRYGLRVDWWIDERMDPEKATHAAAKYFKNLYDQFGSWYLAAASYNAGEGRVLRAVKKHNTEDFWELASRKKPLARETKEYVPKYLAAMLIGKDPANFGFNEQDYSEGLNYDKVRVSEPTDLRVIAEASGTSVEEIKRLNPELLRWFTPPNYPNYEVKIPAGRTEMFVANMSKLPPAKKMAFVTHKVRRGETIAKLAKRYGTSVNPIMYVNDLKGMRVKPGTTLIIPVSAKNGKGKEVAEVRTHMELQS